MPWQSVPRANFMFLHAARLQAHYAVQWLGRAARAYVPAQPHGRHISLGWDGAFGGLTTHPLPDGEGLAQTVFIRRHDQFGSVHWRRTDRAVE